MITAAPNRPFPSAAAREQVRCEKCRRLLFVALGAIAIEIKCKCGHLQVRTLREQVYNAPTNPLSPSPSRPVLQTGVLPR